MLDKEKVQEALKKHFNNSDYLIVISYQKKSKNVEIKKESILKEIELYIENVKEMVKIFYDEKQKIKFFYTIAEYEKIYVARIVVENFLSEDKMNGIFDWIKARNIKDIENLGGYLMKDGIKEVKYSQGFFKGINTR